VPPVGIVPFKGDGNEPEQIVCDEGVIVLFAIRGNTVTVALLPVNVVLQAGVSV
jgi:hypothetical protein